MFLCLLTLKQDLNDTFMFELNQLVNVKKNPKTLLPVKRAAVDKDSQLQKGFSGLNVTVI